MTKKLRFWSIFGAFLIVVLISRPSGAVENVDDVNADFPTVESELRPESHGSRTDERMVVDEAIRSGQRYEFQAEVSRMMNIIINSLYTKKEIFLRELISNASDALDKIRYLALTSPSVLEEFAKLDIRVEADPETRILQITDTGIGMTRDELISSLGTIASSGTKNFLDNIQEGADLSLIGQFGVGFYSVYLVADKVTVVTKSPEDVQLIWESSADDTFSISEDPRGSTLGRGTSISIHLREDASEFLEEERLKELVKYYSEFINFPIYLKTAREVEKEVDVEEPEDEVEELSKVDEEAAAADIEVEEADEDVREKKTVKETIYEWTLLNENKPIWTRSQKEVTDEEYENFYKALTKEYDNAAAHVHFSAEGDVSFRSILFIPGHGAPDVGAELSKAMNKIKLYVRKVFISEDLEDILPRFLSFLRGVVDSDDLPLNISREYLQQSRLIRMIRKKLVRKALEMMKKLADREIAANMTPEEDEDVEGEFDEDEDSELPEKVEYTEKDKKAYTEFWKNFGVYLRIGIIEDTSNKNRLAKLLRYETTYTDRGEYISLEQYVERMKPGQKSIYYITGESREALEESPLLEELQAREIEVLLMVDPVDEYMLQSFNEFEGHKLQDVAKEDMKVEGEDADDVDHMEKEYKERMEPLTTFFLDSIGRERVQSVVPSTRIRSSPCILVASQWGLTANMERILKAQALNDQPNTMKARRVLMLNPHHPVMKEMITKVDHLNSLDDDDDEKKELGKEVKDLCFLLYETAAIQSGFEIEDVAAFSKRIHKVVKRGLELDISVEVDEEEMSRERDEAVSAGKLRSEREKEEEEALGDDDEWDDFEDEPEEEEYSGLKDEL